MYKKGYTFLLVNYHLSNPRVLSCPTLPVNEPSQTHHECRSKRNWCDRHRRYHVRHSTTWWTHLRQSRAKYLRFRSLLTPFCLSLRSRSTGVVGNKDKGHKEVMVCLFTFRGRRPLEAESLLRVNRVKVLDPNGLSSLTSP